MENKEQLHNWYKESFNKLSAEPPADAWDAISDALDKKQPIVPARTYKKWLGTVVLLCISLTAAVVFFLTRTTKPFGSEAVKQQQATANDQNIPSRFNSTFQQENRKMMDKKNGPVTNNETALSTQSVLMHRIAGTTKQYSNDFSEEVDSKMFFESDGNSEEGNVQELSMSQDESELVKDNSPQEPADMLFTKQSLLGEDKLNKTLPEVMHAIETSAAACHPDVGLRGIYAGGAFLLNNTWLLNYDTYNGFKRSELNDVAAYITAAFSINGGYRFSDNYSLQTEWNIQNKQGQKYKEYIEGKQLNRNVTLNYMQWNVVLKSRQRTFTYKNQIPVLFHTLAGLQYGHLKSAEEEINNQTMDISNNYRKSSYGVLFGIAYEAVVSKRMFVGTALRGNFGVNNVFAGNQKIPAHFLKTFNTSLGIHVGVNYMITGK